MAHEIATNWALDAYAAPMSDYMGLVKTGNHPNFYYRIIPEVKGFGLNYESVDICGVLDPKLDKNFYRVHVYL
ncbi:hypothetical protein PENPOL_c014G09920 [Penicillium polonicum]|uniref:Uncharacterized protein n=1 Tax=Penicillium polonicum TaxID=60169 RepID=A0A1V6NAX7_PENPO|nr:hypothetical protein PENPOL_c014G09920 [Penicillium polonicum]